MEILLTGLGASLGGAVAGGFFGSYLQVYFSSRSDRTKDHLSDLKENVVNPLINTVSSFNFTPSDFTFSGFRYEEVAGLQSTDVLFEDFMTNHYRDIRTKLKETIRLSLDLANKIHNLLNQLKANLSNTFRDLKPTEGQMVNLKAVDTLAEAILDEYDKTFLRITSYIETRKLYFYPVEYPLIAFSESQKYEIFSSALTSEQANIRSVDEIKDTLIEAIDEIRNRLASELESYNESKRAFTNERNILLNRLLRVKYGTKLSFGKQYIRKKCSLV
jgi:hypothetical protein